MPRGGPTGQPTVNNNSTFAEWVAWLDYKTPGAGEQFLNWIPQQMPAGSPPVDVGKNIYGPPPNNKAENWVAAWILLGNVGPELGKLIGLGIESGSKDIPKALKGVAQGIGKVPGAKALGGLADPLAGVSDFLSRLEQASTWERVLLIGLGGVLLAIGTAKITGAVPVATKIAKRAGAVALA